MGKILTFLKSLKGKGKNGVITTPTAPTPIAPATPPVTFIAPEKVSRLHKRLFSNNPFDIPLIYTIANEIGLDLPDEDTQDFQLEIWHSFESSDQINIQVVVGEKVVKSEMFRVA